MEIKSEYTSDFEKILSHRFDQGADLWTTPDNRLINGSPYSTLESIMYLRELGLPLDDPLVLQVADLILSTWQADGRFKLYPKGSIYPCQTIAALDTLCHLGFANDPRVIKTLDHLLGIQQPDGGWRCNKFSYGHGPETVFSNPFPTLMALSAFRYTAHLNTNVALDSAAEFLLEHWKTREPIGPCHYGIGKLFMQLEYPFRTYNLFVYVYVLSFYNRAKKDGRFIEALQVLQSKLVNGQIVVERTAPKLSELTFCKKGHPSQLATQRYEEILTRLKET